MTKHLGMKLIFSVLFMALCQVQYVFAQNMGVVFAEDLTNPSNYGHYCMMYNPRFNEIPEDEQSATFLQLHDLTPSVMCEPPENPPTLTNTASAVMRGNCTFSEKAALIQQYGAKAALVVSDSGLVEPQGNTSSDYKEINITVAVLEEASFKQIKGLAMQISDIRVKMYAPMPPSWDYNLILIWVLATLTIFIGALWSGHVKHQQFLRKRRHSGPSTPGGKEVAPQEDEEPETLDVSPKVIFVFVILMCSMLVALYFLYDYLVYAIIGLFCLASCLALYACLKPFIIRIPFCKSCRIPPNCIPLLKTQPEVRRILLALFCEGVAIWWGIVRNDSYAWILQDLLGVVFCINMMKTVRLPSLKACTILLVLLFIYDIFFVFITPLFTKSGQSVMVDVATGGSSSSGEMLPMVLKVPRFSSSVLSVCNLPYSLLGFGDILVPGLLVSYCYGFDLKVQSQRIYFISSLIAYGVGLVVTFVALALMSVGQPALLYLVPCTLITTSVVARCRGEFCHMWRGELGIDDSEEKTIVNQEEAPDISNHDPTLTPVSDPTLTPVSDSTLTPLSEPPTSPSFIHAQTLPSDAFSDTHIAGDVLPSYQNQEVIQDIHAERNLNNTADRI